MSKLIIGVVCLFLGLGVLGASLIVGFTSRSTELEALEQFYNQLEAELQEARERVGFLRDEFEMVNESLSTLEDKKSGLQEEVDSGSASVLSQERRQSKEIDAMNESLESLRVDLDKRRDSLAEVRGEILQQSQFSNWLIKNQNFLLTIYLPDQTVRSATLINNGQGRTLILTSADGLPLEQTFLGLVQNDSGSRPARLQLAIKDVDSSGTIASLGLVEGSYRATGLLLREKGQPQVGDAVYSLASVKMGDVAVHYSVFDGVVSATHRAGDQLAMYQVSLPANDGSQGAPVLDKEGKFIGLFVHRAAGDLRQSYVVPINELREVIRKF